MAKKNKVNPLFEGGRLTERFLDRDPNGTGDGFRLHSGDVDEDAGAMDENMRALMAALLKPKRQPVGTPAFVGEVEALEILEAYGVVNLTPLNKLDFQLLGIIKGLEEEVKQLRPPAAEETED